MRRSTPANVGRRSHDARPHGTPTARRRPRGWRGDLHFGKDDFKDESRLVRALSRDRAKDMAIDYAKADPVRDFAERRGITFRERVAEIARKLPERAREIFEHFRPASPARAERDIFADFKPALQRDQQPREVAAHRPPLSELQPMRTGGLRGAVERYAKAVDAIQQTRAADLEMMPHQREALDRARAALGAIRPAGSTDLNNAFHRGPELIREAAEGRSQAAMRAMQLETEIRIDPYARADRFVEGWQQLRRQHAELERDGNFRGARRAAQEMHGMAKSLERDPQLESVLRGRDRRDLGLSDIPVARGGGIGRDLADSIPFDHGREISRGLSR